VLTAQRHVFKIEKCPEERRYRIVVPIDWIHGTSLSFSPWPAVPASRKGPQLSVHYELGTLGLRHYADFQIADYSRVLRMAK
jgi:hypothetical protein